MIVKQVPEMPWQDAGFVRCGCGIISVRTERGNEQHLSWWAGYENQTVWWTVREVDDG